MKILVILIFIFSHSLFARPLSEGWKLVRQQDNVWIWQLENSPDVVGTIQSKLIAKPIAWSSLKSEAFFKKLTSKKKKILSLIGIKKWKANNYKWQKTKRGYELSINGSYRDSSGKKISFKEHHIYMKNKNFQVLVTRPSRDKASRKVAEEFLVKAKTMAATL